MVAAGVDTSDGGAPVGNPMFLYYMPISPSHHRLRALQLAYAKRVADTPANPRRRHAFRHVLCGLSRLTEVIRVKRLLIIMAIIASCAITSCKPVTSPATSNSGVREEIVRENCQIVLDAVVAFAAANDGWYPIDIASDTTQGGHTLIDFLPEGTHLENPFTGEQTEPVDGYADEPGEVGYQMGYHPAIPSCYTITGFGAESLIVELSNIPALEDSVRANCYRLRDAVEEFAARNDGIYPSDTDVDTTPFGETVVDFLPGGHLMENPFTRMATEPVNMSACNPGETGHQAIYGTHPVHGPGVCVGYCITGAGRRGTVIITIVFQPDDE
jgi:hypothetical protein